jgi:signal recognition particle subunit SRP54
MFNSLTSSFGKIINRLMGSGAITEQHLQDTLSQMRLALIDADVSLAVVDKFIASVKQKASGQQIIKSVSAAQMIIKIINDEMVACLSAPAQEQGINLQNGLNTILMLGLQGSGKTTSCAKLASFFKKQGKRVLLVSADTYRPAAIEQLEILSHSIDVDFFKTPSNDPLEIVRQGLYHAQNDNYDLAIFDTAGRLEIDGVMIGEACQIKRLINPCESLLVVDSLSGQSAFAVAARFNEAVGITGSILTRIDGEARGGAALTVRYITQKPIKFLGVGEKTDALELFDAARIAGRIIGMGDVVSLVEKAASVISKEDADKAAERMQKGIFTLDDYLAQISNLKKIGGLQNVLKMMPGAAGMQDKINSSKLSNSFSAKQEAIIFAMTKKERRNVAILNTSRKNRIAKGSGSSVSEVQKLLKQFEQMQSMVKKASKMNLSSLMSKIDVSKLFF